jgi:hypothetical protein
LDQISELLRTTAATDVVADRKEEEETEIIPNNNQGKVPVLKVHSPPPPPPEEVKETVLRLLEDLKDIGASNLPTRLKKPIFQQSLDNLATSIAALLT